MSAEETSTEAAPVAAEASEQVAETPAAPTPPPPTPRATEALRTLMDREAKVREAEAALKQQQRQVVEAQRLSSLAKDNPLHFLDQVGVSYEDITQRVIQGERPDPTIAIRQEVQQLRNELNTRRQREESTQRQAAFDEAKNLVVQFVDQSTEYPLTKAAGMQNLVFQRVYDHYNETGETLSEANAANEVEEYLSGVVDKLSELEAVKKRFEVQGSVTETPTATNLANTLTNAHSASTPTRKDEGMLSESESLKRAAAMLEYVNNT